MKLLFKQRFFTWFDSYDIFDENGDTVYTVEGTFAWGKCLHILDKAGAHAATLKQRVLTFFPTFDLYLGDEEEFLGSIKKEFSFFKPSFAIDYLGWHVEGDWLEWDYEITEENGGLVATVSKDVFRLMDTYCMDIRDPADALYVLMLVLAIDAEKDSRS
ncbi:MAG: LURP-one-related/scramblase family protein [Eubacteriales bacterium]